MVGVWVGRGEEEAVTGGAEVRRCVCVCVWRGRRRLRSRAVPGCGGCGVLTLGAAAEEGGVDQGRGRVAASTTASLVSGSVGAV